MHRSASFFLNAIYLCVVTRAFNIVVSVKRTVLPDFWGGHALKTMLSYLQRTIFLMRTEIIQKRTQASRPNDLQPPYPAIRDDLKS